MGKIKSFFKGFTDDHGGTKVRKIDMVALGMGDFGYGLVSSTVATYITSFGTMALPGVDKVGFTSLLMGIAVGIAVIFDAVSDPIMGFLSDHFKSKVFGKRHLFMLIGLIGMMASALAVWYIPYENMNAAGIFIWFTLFLILLRTFNTMYYTPVGAFSVEISTDYNERTTIQAVRSVLYIIGLLLCVVVMGSFQNKYAGFYDAANNLVVGGKTIEKAMENADAAGISLDGLVYRKGQQLPGGYRDFALVGTVITVVTSAFLLLTTRRYVKILRLREEKEAEQKGIDLNAPEKVFTKEECREELIAEGNNNPSRLQIRNRLQKKRADAGQVTIGAIFRNFFASFKVKEMRTIAIGYVVAMMSATLIISLGFNVFTFTFDLTNTQMYVLMGALLFCTIGFQPLWMKLSKTRSKQFAMFAGLVVSFIGCIVLFVCFLCRGPINELLATDKEWWGVVLLAPSLMLAGAGTGVLYSMPLALVGDVVVLQKDMTGQDKTGTYAGVMTFCYKAGQGIITAVSTALMGFVGFKTGEASQTREASDGIGWILCIGVLIFVGAGIIIFSTLKLDKAKISEILEVHKKQAAELSAGQNTATEEPAIEEAAATDQE